MAFDVLGWILAIIVGGLAGWLASRIMKVNTSLMTNIILGVVGAIIGSLLSVANIPVMGVFTYLIAGLIGAVILIAIAKAVTDRRA